MNNFAVVIANGYETKGLGRYAYGFGIAPNVRLYYPRPDDNLKDLISEENIILAGYLDIPQEIADRKIYMMACSPLGQMYLSGVELEILYNFLVMRQEKKIVNVVATCRELSAIYGFVNLPAVRRNFKPFYSEERSGYSFIGNNNRAQKNIANTMAAISMLPENVVYVNDPNLYIPYQVLFGVSFEKFSPNDQDYSKLISTHKILFQVDYSNSFNYLALEYAMSGIPTVCSKCMYWYPKECLVDNPDSPFDIANVAKRILTDEKLYKDLSENLPDYAMKVNSENSFKLRELFEEL